MPCNKKCSKMATLWSGSHSSMWKRNRCRPYSNSVQMKLPRKKHAVARPTEVLEIDARAATENGARGAEMKFGRGREKPTRERTSRLRVIGPQTAGTTNHFVRVNICKL